MTRNKTLATFNFCKRKLQTAAAGCGLLASFALFTAAPSYGQLNLGSISIGAGIRTDFTNTEPAIGPDQNDFNLDNIRLYISGPVTKHVSFMFNTDYSGPTDALSVMDAAVQFDFNPHFHVWVGRFLPPSDRANLYGPFYANHWEVYSDGIQDGYPSTAIGRDNGAVYWGDFLDQHMKVSVGAFDGKAADGNPDVLFAERVQFDFWDKEVGYFQNSTYYGDKNILAIGGANQVQSGKTASSIDFLLDRKLPNKGVFTIESEYADYNGLGGYFAGYKSQGAYALASYMFPKQVGVGKFQALGKYAYSAYRAGVAPFHQETTEIDFNYIIKEFNARVMSFYQKINYNTVQESSWRAGIGLQFQI